MKEIKLQQLRENFNRSKSEMSFGEYVKRESENDPDFFRWLFDDDNLDGYSTLSIEQSNEFDEMLETIALEDVEGGVTEIHLGLRKSGNGYYVDLIDRDGNIHEGYVGYREGNRKSAESFARDLYEADKVIFDY